jgi:hypothetical protein
MERDSFVFYRSFYEALRLMPKEVQTEVYPAIVEYALNGREPEELSDIARAVFILVRPNIDSSVSRISNGKKGAPYGKLGGRPAKKQETAVPTKEQYTLTLEQEIDVLRNDSQWSEPVCMKFGVSADKLKEHLADFFLHCQSECDGKAHTGINDAKRHFCSWMRKAHPVSTSQHKAQAADNELPPPSYEFNGGFGGQDV